MRRVRRRQRRIRAIACPVPRARAAPPTSAPGGLPLGVVGQLAPAIAEARGFPPANEIYVAEIDPERSARLAAPDEPRAESLPRFPSIVRDISILVDDTLPAAAVRGTIRSSAPPTLVSIVEFDRYQGKGVPDGRVSLSLRLTFRDPERTLTDEEAQQATERIVEALRAGTARSNDRRLEGLVYERGRARFRFLYGFRLQAGRSILASAFKRKIGLKERSLWRK